MTLNSVLGGDLYSIFAWALGLIIPRSQSVSGHVVKGKSHRSELTERNWENAVQGLGNPLSVRFYSDKEDTEALKGRELYSLRSQTLY